MPAKISVRKRAALKAWETRRANAGETKSETKSENEKTWVKGWAYVARTVEKHSTRHEAAVKAWETRRAVKEELTPVNPKLKRSFAATGSAALRYNEKTEEIMVQTANGGLVATGKFLADYKIKLSKSQIGKMDRGSSAALKAWATRREGQI